MKIVRFMLHALALSTMMQTACAHTHLKSSIPSDKSELSTAPKELKLTFEDAVQLTAVKLTLADGQSQSLTPLPKDAAKEATLSLPSLKSGSYVISWRAAGHDGHVMSGLVTFKVK